MPLHAPALTRRLALLVGALTLLALQAAPAPAPHRFVAVDNESSRLIHVDQRHPQANWSVAIPAGSRDLQVLDEQRLLVGHGNGCGIYRLSDGAKLWACDQLKGVESARYLAASRQLLLAQHGKGTYEFRWLDADGDGFKLSPKTVSVPVKDASLLRLARVLDNGHLLFTAGPPYRVVEWDPAAGKEAWGAALPGKGYLAERLADGTTLATTGGSVSVVQYDANGQVVHTWLGEKFKKALRLNWFSGFQSLGDGRVFIANWLGHGANGTGPHLFEVDRDNQVLWSWEDHTVAKQLTNALCLDDLGAGKHKGVKEDKQARPSPTNDEFDRLKRHLKECPEWNRARLAREAFRQDALILPSDRNPVDVLWRRTQALRADLLAKPHAPDLSAETADLARLEPAVKAGPTAEAEQRDLFGRLAAVRRRIAFRNPLLDFDKIVFLKHPRMVRGDRHMVDQYLGFNQAKAGGVYVLENAFGTAPATVRNLLTEPVSGGRLAGRRLEDNGSFIGLDLDYDGKSIAFAYTEAEWEVPAGASWADQRWTQAQADSLKGNRFYHWRPNNTFHVFRANIDGSALTQLGDGPYNEFDPVFLPSGRLAYVSERVGGGQRCGARLLPSAALFSMAGDGSDPQQLSWHDTNEWHPSVDHDGMLVYTRWDYVDRDSDIAHHLWRCFPDGRDPRSPHGNYPLVRETRPWMEMDIRAIPGSHRYVAVAAAHHGENYGSLVTIDLHETDDGSTRQLRRLTPEVGFPEAERAPGYPIDRSAKKKDKSAPKQDDLPDPGASTKNVGENQTYSTPWPLSEDYYLCVGQLAGNNYGIFLLDSFGNRELLYADPKLPCLDPIPLKARPRPPVIPAATTQQLPERTPKTDLTMGTVFVRNIYESDQPWPAGTKITALRVVNIFPKPNAFLDVPHIGTAAQSLARGVLGTVPVAPDGSVYFKLPAGAPVYFQAIDDKGLAVHTMRSDTYVHPGETLSCVGCHESKHKASPNLAANPAALGRAPATLTPEVSGSYPLTFPRLVQPVLDAKCVDCHSKAAKAPGLRGDKFVKGGWSEAFESLRKLAWGRSGGNGTIFKEGRQFSVPGQDCARVSKLYKLLSEGHHGVKLTAEELHRITLWIDCNSNFYGWYYETEKQAKGELVKPREGVPAWLGVEGLLR